MKTSNKILISIIILLVMLFLGIWLFNHISAWLGVAAIVLWLYVVMRVIIYFVKQLNNSKQ